MSTFLFNDEKKKKKTWDEQIFSNFKIQPMGEVEEEMSWTERFDQDPNLKIPMAYMGAGGVDMKKLLKKYPLLGQEYAVLTTTAAQTMVKQIEEEGYICHVYLNPENQKVGKVQIYAHKDFLTKNNEGA